MTELKARVEAEVSKKKGIKKGIESLWETPKNIEFYGGRSHNPICIYIYIYMEWDLYVKNDGVLNPQLHLQKCSSFLCGQRSHGCAIYCTRDKMRTPLPAKTTATTESKYTLW